MVDLRIGCGLVLHRYKNGTFLRRVLNTVSIWYFWNVIPFLWNPFTFKLEQPSSMLPADVIMVHSLLVGNTLTVGFSMTNYFRRKGIMNFFNLVIKFHHGQFEPKENQLNNENIMKLDLKLSKCRGINISEITISELQILFQVNRLTSLQLTRCYLKRIKLIDTHLHSVIEINPDADSIAAQMDKERKGGHVRGKLHGIPILIKDNIGTTDKMQTTAGSLALIGVRPRVESTVIQRLRKAGAVILGKTNLSEFAGLRDTQIQAGWSSRGNQTMNPYVMSADPSGSSTGSAVAVAANLAVIALGTETFGSIISPSNRASLVGLKPTLGLVPTDGVIPLAFSQDCVGLMTRSVSDAGILFNVLAQDNFQFPDTSFHVTESFRVGVFRDPFWNFSADQLPQLENALSVLKNSSLVTVVDPVGVLSEPPLPLYVDPTVVEYEFKFGINEYLKKCYIPNGGVASLADIIQFNINQPIDFGQDLLIQSAATDGLQSKVYKRRRNRNMRAARILFTEVLKQYNLDAIVTPTENRGKSENVGDPFAMASITGHPSITVPIGFTEDNLPFGILLQSALNTEHKLIKLAAIIENKIQGRRRPRFLS